VADAGRLVRRDDVVPHAHLRRFRLRLRRRGQWVKAKVREVGRRTRWSRGGCLLDVAAAH
jgi:hypothetical protein